jgi:nucleoside-diphosphate-sugar epimerase
MQGQNTILIAGATGVVGRAAVEHFARDPGWNVIALSRRKPDAAGAYRHLSLDLTDSAACAAAGGQLGDVTHVVFAALYEKPGLVRGWREQDQMQTNLAMLRNLLDPLQRVAKHLQHITLLQGTKAYGAHLHPIPVPAREDAPRDNHANFYWLQEDFLRDAQRGKDWRFTIFRPQIVFGHALASPMNLLAALGAWAALCKAEGRPFSYSGGAAYPCEAIDADLLAEAFDWAAHSPSAANELFNITNGDVFQWPDVWPAMASALQVETGPSAPLFLAKETATRAALWQQIVQRHGLVRNTLAGLVGDSFHYADFVLAPAQVKPPPPVLLSTIKLRQAGFAACRDTQAMLRDWFTRLRAMKLLP